MTSPGELERLLVGRVGGYLRNTDRRPGITCGICTTPTGGRPTCYRCQEDRSSYGQQLADLVVPICYGGHNPQSKTLLYGYKKELAASPGDERRVLLSLLLAVTLTGHGHCIARAVAAAYDTYVVVPSTNRRPNHPLPVVVGAALPQLAGVTATPKPASPPGQAVDPVRFTIPADLRGRHVLVIDDTWASGGRAQSMSIAVRRAGARLVTVVVLARWLNANTWAPTEQYLKTKPHQVFDPRRCPVGIAGHCPG